tara:strand:- start:223 stop:981 length:759 start_codon:yes stop_codon:yes gene_type:complete
MERAVLVSKLIAYKMITENNFIETESSLIRKHKKLLWENKEEYLMIDLGRNIPVFKWFISKKSTWESSTVMYKTENLLYQIAAAHKQFPNDSVKDMLTDAAKRMRNISKGGMISNVGYDYIIDKAIELKEVIDVAPNTTIRYLKNPYFIWTKEDYPNRKEIYRTHLNIALNKTIVEVNTDLIKNALMDYDLNQKKMTKTILSKITTLSLSTIKNYLNTYSELNDIYALVKEHSETDKQKKSKVYNLNKKKVA